MGRRGPPPLPDNVKKIRGTAQKCRMNGDAPQFPADAVQPPDFLTPDQRLHFLETVALLKEANVLTNADIECVALYSQSLDVWKRATKALTDEGEVILDKHGEPKVNPWHKVAADAFERCRKYQQELGLTPSARTRVKATQKPKAPEGFGKFASVKPVA